MSNFNERTRSVCTQIAQTNREVPQHMRENPENTELGWAVAEVLYLMGDTAAADILYWDGSFYPADDEWKHPLTGHQRCTGVVVAVTKSHVYRAIAAEDGELKTTVQPLALQSLTLTSLQVSFSSERDVEPYMPEVDIFFHDGSGIHLPIQPGATDDTHTAVAKMLPELRSAITR
ncbi:hypothetical protein M3694_01450 [Kocuria marina]|uniref:hypothetical protein n=1 Tax=Kocuria marina TaxID=223184 RepID=UPI002989D5C7|nr:hypothetical protein [Kocuria marina]MCT2360433.1 hypothetical protein [Kocuria marina]